MNLDELRPILAAYRQQVEPAWSPATAHPGYDGKAGDPAGQCGVTSAWLQRRLREDHGIETTYCVGAVFYINLTAEFDHCWLEMGNPHYADWVIIDITGDQLRGRKEQQVLCSTHASLCANEWLYYQTGHRLTADELLADPVQPRLAILTEALS